MSIDQIAYNSARAAIRELLTLDEDEIVDRVFLAAVIANFDPHREVPVWLVITGEPASGKTELTDLLHGWRPVWTLPDPLSPGYFHSAINERVSADPVVRASGSPRRGCAMRQIEATGARILYLHDMMAIFAGDSHSFGKLYSQLVGIHDGYLKYETGASAVSIVYGPKVPAERLGWISTATERFYEWQAKWSQFGTRFLVYYLEPRAAWEDTSFLTGIATQTRRQERRDHARAAVQGFLTHAVDRIASLADVEIEPRDVDRLSAAVTLVQRALAATSAQEGGVRLHSRVVQFARIFAWVSGEVLVANRHILDAVRVALSQLPPPHQRVLLFALRRAHEAVPWCYGDLNRSYGRRSNPHRTIIEEYTNLGILESSERLRRGTILTSGYQLSAKTRALVKSFDPQGVLFPLAEGGTVPEEFDRVM